MLFDGMDETNLESTGVHERSGSKIKIFSTYSPDSPDEISEIYCNDFARPIRHSFISKGMIYFMNNHKLGELILIESKFIGENINWRNKIENSIINYLS
jgi:hypothetical protein